MLGVDEVREFNERQTKVRRTFKEIGNHHAMLELAHLCLRTNLVLESNRRIGMDYLVRLSGG